MTESEGIHTVVLEQKPDDLRSEADAKFERERRAFWAMRSQLLPDYEGKYVAVLNGQVIDSDADERALVQRVYQKFGYQPMYVQLVTSGPLPRYHVMSPKAVMR